MKFASLLLCFYLSLPVIISKTYPLKIEKFITSPVLPAVGDKIKFRTTILNEAKESYEKLNLSLSLIKGNQKKSLGKVEIEKIKAGERLNVELGEWVADRNGIREIELLLEAGGFKKEIKFSFPVVERKVEFAWYGTPKDLLWPTITTTIENDYLDQWLWEGRTPLVFKPGVCFWDKHKDADLEEQVLCWSKVPQGAAGIGIDEYIGGESGDKVSEVIKRFKKENPHLKVALWTSGGIPADIASYVDYFIPECYLNYHNMHLGHIYNSVKEIREKNMERKTLLGLGINYEPAQGTALTTNEELESQFEILKKYCPKLLGVAIFYYGSVPQLDKKADELFYRYFVLPVLTYDWEIKNEKGKPAVTGWVKNIGNMDGGPFEIVISVDGKEAKKATFQWLRVDELKNFVFPLDDLASGFHIIKVKIKTTANQTIINNEKEEIIGIKVSAIKSRGGVALFLPPCPYPRKKQPLRFSLPERWLSGRVFFTDLKGKTFKELPSQVNGENELVWIEGEIPPGDSRIYLLFPAEEKGSSLSSLPNQRIDFANEFYSFALDISKDEIVSLRVSGEELFSSPWRIELHPASNWQPIIGKVEVRDGEVFKEVTIPFKGEGYQGISHYIFYYKSPIVEIRRQINPDISLELDSAREGAGFPQREGFYRAFSGEGALRLSQGKLENTDRYKDIYFGYLGNSPEPENSEKAGWFDFCWDKPAIGLGIGIVKRWIDSKSRTYDVTRFYDAGDWVDVFYVFQTKTKINRPQLSFLLLLPHKSADFEKETVPILPYYYTEKRPLKVVPSF